MIKKAPTLAGSGYGHRPTSSTQYEIIAGDGEIYGPYSLEDLQQYLDKERVQWGTQVRVLGTDDWMPIIRLISPPEVETTAATTTEYEPSVDGGSADINVLDALKKGWCILQKNKGLLLEYLLWADCCCQYQVVW